MAKKKETKVEVAQPEVKATNEMAEVKVETKPEPKKKAHVEDGWEIRDRTYFLKGYRKPLSQIIKGSDIYYFDQEKGYERELNMISSTT